MVFELVILYILTIPLMGMLFSLFVKLAEDEELQAAKKELKETLAKESRIYELLDWLETKLNNFKKGD